jgi:hypothetical protein
MSSISSAAAQAYSPLQRLQSTLSSEVADGTVSADDQSALSSALSDIDTTLKSQMQAGGARPSPEDMKAKIDDLISNEVSQGNLTSAQADELKNVFASTFQGGPGGAHGGHGAHGAGGPPPDGVASSDDSNGDDDDSTTSATASTTSSSTDASQLLQDFLKQLQETQSESSTYGADGNNTTADQQSLVVNYSV